MLTGGDNPLGSVFTEGGTDRRAMALAYAQAGGHVLFVDPSSKAPLDLRSAMHRGKDDTAERERTGDPKATAPTGLYLATSNDTLLKRYWTRAEKDGVEPNIALHCEWSGLVCVDADTGGEVRGVQELGNPENPERYSLTTRSPGQRNSAGEWIHKDGGHFIFTVPAGTPLLEDFKLPGGAVVSMKGRYFLVPPSERPEGPYTNVGPVRSLADAPWLRAAMAEQWDKSEARTTERTAKAAERIERREAGETDDLGTSLTAWHAAHSWPDLLTDAGWEPNHTGRNGRPLRSQRVDKCGCRTWTAPGDHADGKSATAHEDDCREFTPVGGAWPLKIWTTNPPDTLAGAPMWTKSTYVAATKYGGDYRAMLLGENIVDAYAPVDVSEYEFGSSGAIGDNGSRADPHDPALMADVFGYSPVMAHILEQARARMVGPWSSLLVALVHAVVLTPWQVRLPALVGGEASVNMIVALVGGSGAGKGASTGSSPMLEWASPDPLEVHPALAGADQSAESALSPITVGSGEAIATLFRDWRTTETTGDDGKVRKALSLVTVRRTAWMDFPEVDQVAALMRRESSTLSAELRKMWDGRQLGVHTKSKERRSEVASFTYRAATTIGVQPERAEALLSGEDGGLPQRLVWAATTDPGLGDDDVPLSSYVVDPPPWRLDGDGPVTMEVAAAIRTEIRDARRRVQRGEPGALTGIDAHRNLVRLKLAAAVAVLHSRTSVTDDDWRLAGLILDHSDRVRDGVRRTLHAATTATYEARGAADAARERGARRTRDDEVDKAAASVYGWLANRKGRAFTIRDIQAAAKSGSARRLYAADAIEILIGEGSLREAGSSRVGTPTFEWNSDREATS